MFSKTTAGTLGPPDAVDDLVATAISSNQVDLTWSKPKEHGSAITGYLIQRSLNGGGAVTLENSFGDSSTTSYSDTTLVPGDTVKYRIAAINSEGIAPFSNVSLTVVVSGGAFPDTVTDLVLTVVSE